LLEMFPSFYWSIILLVGTCIRAVPGVNWNITTPTEIYKCKGTTSTLLLLLRPTLYIWETEYSQTNCCDTSAN